MTQQDKRVWGLIAALVLVLALAVPVSSGVFGVNYDYTLTVVALGGGLLGMLSGALGSFAVLRQESLLGDALSHAALPGVAIAFLVAGRDLPALLLGAAIAGWIGVQFISAVTATTRIKQDAAMGMALSAFFAVGIALLSYIQGRGDAAQAGLDKFIFGQAAAIRRADVELIALAGLVALLVLLIFWKEFKLVTFNREFAAANGYPVALVDGLLSLLIVGAIVLGLQVAGVILMVGLLIAPGVAARQWTHHLGQMVVLAGIFGGFAGATGAIISGIDVGLPTGPLIIVVASVLVALSLLLAPERGVLRVWMQQRADRKRFAALTILRDLYSHALQHNNLHEPMSEQTLVKVRGGAAQEGLRQLAAQSAITQARNGWYLTDHGIALAAADARNQQLWNLYRRHHHGLDLLAVAEDRDQPIDKVLPAEDVRRLEMLRKGEAF